MAKQRLNSALYVSTLVLAAAIALGLMIITQDHSLHTANGATVTSRKPKNDQNCTNHLQIIDRCSSMATYSFTSPSNQYPNNTSEMKASCDRISEGLKCLKIHGKCLTSIARRSLTSYASARTRHSKKLCTNMNDPKSIDFMKLGPCIANSNKRPLMVAEERQLIAAIQFLALNKTMKWDDRFHGACCAASHYKSKVVRDMEPQCTKHKESLEEMLTSMIGDLLDTACPEQARLTEICSKLAKLKLPKEWKAASLTGAALDLILALDENPATKR